MKGRKFWKRQFDIVMTTNAAFARQCAALKQENTALKELLHIKVKENIDALLKIAELEEKLRR